MCCGEIHPGVYRNICAETLDRTGSAESYKGKISRFLTLLSIVLTPCVGNQSMQGVLFLKGKELGVSLDGTFDRRVGDKNDACGIVPYLK
jgi:hypothetical protein